MNYLIELLQHTVFHKNFVDEDRSIEDNALFTVEIPLFSSIFGYGDLDDGKEAAVCGLVPPHYLSYIQLVVIVLLQTIFNAVLGLFLFKVVVEPKQRIQKSGSDDPLASGRAILFAFGLALPCVVMEPIYLSRTLGVKNMCLIMVLLATPIVNSLRIAEAAFGFTPVPERLSLWNYIIYFSCTQIVRFNPVCGKPQYASLQSIGKTLMTLARDIALACLILSVLKPYNFEVFDTGREVHSMDHDLNDLFCWKHLLNNYLVAFLISTTVSQGSIAVAAVYNIFYRVETHEMVLNPMLKSKSPSDFWGRRWNMMVHKGLKNGVYKPTRKQTSSRVAGVFATFVVSGILHEYVNYIMFLDRNNGNITPYRFRWKQMLFFGWNGILIILEYCIGNWNIFKWMSKNLPQVVVSTLVISAALPLVHLFTGDWILYGYFDNVYSMEFVVLCNT